MKWLDIHKCRHHIINHTVNSRRTAFMPRKTDTREKILSTATELFGQHGLHAVSTGQIASTAAVNKALIFYHFGTKEQLFEAVFRERIAEMERRMTRLIAESEPGFPFIEAFIRTQSDFVEEHQDFFRLLIRELLKNDSADEKSMSPAAKDLARVLKPVRNHILLSISIARKNGVMRDVDPMHTLINMISLNIFFFLGMPLLKVVNPEIALEEFDHNRVEHVLDLLLNGLKEPA